MGKLETRSPCVLCLVCVLTVSAFVGIKRKVEKERKKKGKEKGKKEK